MSNRYSHAMNHLSLSDAQKEKILQSVLTEKDTPKKILPMRYVFRIAGIAALFMITVVGVNLYRNGVLPNREQPPKQPSAVLLTDAPTGAPIVSGGENPTTPPDVSDVASAPPSVAATATPEGTLPQTTPPPSQAADVTPTVPTESTKEESAPTTQVTQAPEREKGTAEVLTATEAPKPHRTDNETKGGSGGGGGGSTALAGKEPRSLPAGFSESGRGNGSVTYSNGSQTILFQYNRIVRDSDEAGTLTIGGKSVTIQTSGDVITSAWWQDGGWSYSLSSAEGMDINTLTTLVQGVR